MDNVLKISESTVYHCTLIELDKHHHEKGNITVIENNHEIPFNINRIYYLYDIPGGESRGGHAHKGVKPNTDCGWRKL